MKNVLYLILLSGFLFGCNNQQKPAENKQNDPDIIQSEENHVEYYPNGVKKLEGKLINGERHGVWTFYYENGMKWSEGKYRRGVRDGYSIIYYENGRKKISGEYEDDIRVGTWKVWNDDGSPAGEMDMNEKLSAQDSLKLELK